MADQLSARDWLDQGLKALAKTGFTALKAEPLAKAMGVSRGSFYWHFADIAAFHAAILKHWREVAAEQVIAGLEASAAEVDPLSLLLRRTFTSKQALEKAVRTWAAVDPKARAAAQALRPFFYLPFEHSEDLADQARGVALCEAMERETGDPSWIKWARIHRDIIARFGRFPHRNRCLGRETSPEEQAFLDHGGFGGRRG